MKITRHHTARDVIKFVTASFILPCIFFFLTGCSFMQPRTPPNIYGLEAPSTFPTNLPVSKTRLLIAEPSASMAINNNQIAVKTTPFNYYYLGKSQWVDRAPSMVQALLLRSFQNTNAVISVEDVAVGYNQDYELAPELWDFQAEVFNGASRVKVTLLGRILDRKKGRILAMKRFEATTPITPPTATESPLAVVPAFNTALSKVIQETVIWTLHTLSTFPQNSQN